LVVFGFLFPVGAFLWKRPSRLIEAPFLSSTSIFPPHPFESLSFSSRTFSCNQIGLSFPQAPTLFSFPPLPMDDLSPFLLPPPNPFLLFLFDHRILPSHPAGACDLSPLSPPFFPMRYSSWSSSPLPSLFGYRVNDFLCASSSSRCCLFSFEGSIPPSSPSPPACNERLPSSS